MPKGLKRAKTDGLLVFEAARCYSYQCADRFQSAGGRFAAPLGRHHPHQSENRFRRADFLTASPSREKPLSRNRRSRSVAARQRLPPRLLPSGRSCQKNARSIFLTDVGLRRRRQRYSGSCFGNLRRIRSFLSFWHWRPLRLGLFVTMAYYGQICKKSAIRSTHCFAAVPDSVEPSSWWWRATAFW